MNTHVISAWRQGNEVLCVRLNKVQNQPVVDALNNGQAIRVTWETSGGVESATITGLIDTGVTKRKNAPFARCTITDLDSGQSVKVKRAAKATSNGQAPVVTAPVVTADPMVAQLQAQVAQLTAMLAQLTGNGPAQVVTPAPTGLVLPTITKPKRQAPVLSEEAKAKRDAGLVKAREAKAAKQAEREAAQVANVKAKQSPGAAFAERLAIAES